MQTTVKTMASGYGTYPDAGNRRTGRNKQGGKTGKKGAETPRRATNDFLKTVFSPVRAAEVDPLYSERSYMHLYRSAKNYAALLGADLKLPPAARNFRLTYDKLLELLPAHQELSVRANKSRLEFVVTENFDDRTLYYIPCRIIDMAGNRQLRDICISFFSIFQSSQGLAPLTDDVVLDFIQEELENGYYDSDDQLPSLVREYTRGHISEILAAVGGSPKFGMTELRRQIKRYKPASDRQQAVLNLMLEGLALFKRDCIMRYAGPPPGEDEEGCRVPMYRMLYIVYDQEDPVTENLWECVCDEANNEGYDILSSGSKKIGPRTKKLLKSSKYIPEFLNWLNRFNYELHDIRNTEQF